MPTFHPQKGHALPAWRSKGPHVLWHAADWHSAQHTRQLIAVLDRFGIEPNGRLSTADLAGLSLPEGLWE